MKAVVCAAIVFGLAVRFLHYETDFTNTEYTLGWSYNPNN
jgi:hypothetical protein